MNFYSIMEYFGMIMITLFIPIAILLIERTSNSFEKRIIIKYVINAKNTAVFLILLATSFFIWGIPYIKILSPLLFLVSVGLFILIVKNSYHWIMVSQSDIFSKDEKNIKDRFIIKYLECTDDLENKKEDWESIWGADWKSKAESRLLAIYLEFLGSLFKKEDYASFYQCIDLFSRFFNKRLFSFPNDREFFLKTILSWYAYFHDKENDTDCMMAKIALENIIRESIKSFINQYSILVFKVIEQHIHDKELNYINKLMCVCVCRTFFDNIASSPESEVIWADRGYGCFPDEWKVTLLNLNDKNNFMARIWLREFITWKVSADNDALSKNLNNIIKGLFPDVEPREWEYLLNLLQYQNDMSGLVNQNIYVVSFRARSGWYDGKTNLEEKWREESEKETDNAYNLFIHLFKSNFNKEQPQTNIKILESEDFESMNDIIKLRKDQYIRVYKEFLGRLNDASD